jgi:hypothetical protein
MKNFFSLVLITLLLSAFQSARGASIIPVCRNLNKDVTDCNPSNILFATYAPSDNIMNYKIDRGAIGEISETDARNFADELLRLWESESGIDFQTDGDGFIEEDVDASNYDTYLNNQEPLGYSPVIWDETGELLDDLYGKGSKENILGFAGAVFFTVQGGLAQGIAESRSVFNGYLFNGINTGDDRETIISTFKTTILHEFGHMFGLDHTQGGNDEGYRQYVNGEAELSDLEDVPVMYPIAANPLVELQQDDISAVRLGYPKGDEDELFGTITGKLKQLGSGVKGANVVAYLTDDVNPRKKAIACPSDVDGTGEGSFRLPNLVPGNYVIKAEALNQDFFGPSSVGMHNPISSDLLITSFYTGEGIQPLQTNDLDTGIEQGLHINVSAGSSTDINFDLDFASFKIVGIPFEKVYRLKNNKKRTVTITLRNLAPGQARSIKLSSDYPDLVKFLPSDEINFRKKNFVIKIRLASYTEFFNRFPDIENNGLEIPIVLEDLNSGYKIDSKSLSVF